MLKVISLGAGVQSTTMYLMALHGEFGDYPDAAIFADTVYEPKAVYEHLFSLIALYSPYCEYPLRLTDRSQEQPRRRGEAVIPIHIVQQGNIKEDTLRVLNRTKRDNSRFVTIPLYQVKPNGIKGKLTRQCTKEYKLTPIWKHGRLLAGLEPGQRSKNVVVEQWIGISLDEATRMKPSDNAWQVNRWPLIEKRMTRQDCILWLKRHGYPEPPKSSCVCCPFHNDNFWRKMRDTDTESWQDAVAFDQAIRVFPTVEGEVFLHRSGKPLADVDLSTPQDHGQQEFMFDEECEGMCGV